MGEAFQWHKGSFIQFVLQASDLRVTAGLSEGF